MMVGMMTPSAMPMILMYARVGRETEPQGAPLNGTVWFAAGYFLVWTAFALPAPSFMKCPSPELTSEWRAR